MKLIYALIIIYFILLIINVCLQIYNEMCDLKGEGAYIENMEEYQDFSS